MGLGGAEAIPAGFLGELLPRDLGDTGYRGASPLPLERGEERNVGVVSTVWPREGCFQSTLPESSWSLRCGTESRESERFLGKDRVLLAGERRRRGVGGRRVFNFALS